ncbi:TetR family transcriptional regulator [Virgibacillus alimentarius]|uniref:AcrR family transcriptional regulator n=1 Tax=Virgibacillus alimentarius TaxID=698769 RepID=A0ABS4S9H2_9BACI|nr:MULTISPECIES: TetR family transcriptional regulator [Virgibacillus]MBP2258161.1 AcrR family transcriptional regulator [Virgibacillus alimentarius]HLR69330.1 TetR family transcriptional regulator [Virgibacillus sp.]
MDNKKENIIRSAIDVFQEKGIEKAKVSDIVKGAGIAQGTFYLYFPTKLAVMPSIAQVMVEKTLEEIKKAVQQDSPFSRQLEQVVDAVFYITNEYREIFALIYAGLASSEYLKEWETLYEPYYKWMSGFLKKAKTDGIIRETVHEEHTATLLIGLIEAAAEQSYLYDHQDDNAANIKRQEVLDFLKHALKS